MIIPRRWPTLDWEDRAGDEVPVLVECDGNHRLDVQRALVGPGRSGPEAHVPLDWQTDEVADRVLGELREFFGAVCLRRRDVNRCCERLHCRCARMGDGGEAEEECAQKRERVSSWFHCRSYAHRKALEARIHALPSSNISTSPGDSFGCSWDPLRPDASGTLWEHLVLDEPFVWPDNVPLMVTVFSPAAERSG